MNRLRFVSHTFAVQQIIIQRRLYYIYVSVRWVGRRGGNPYFLCRRVQKVIIRFVNRKIGMLSCVHALYNLHS